MHTDLTATSLDLSYDGSQSPGSGGSLSQQARNKRMRTSFKHHQLRTMKSYFAINQNPDAKDLKQLSQKTGLSKRVLQVSWRLGRGLRHIWPRDQLIIYFDRFRFGFKMLAPNGDAMWCDKTVAIKTACPHPVHWLHWLRLAVRQVYNPHRAVISKRREWHRRTHSKKCIIYHFQSFIDFICTFRSINCTENLPPVLINDHGRK